ncbi:alpha/beta fold hydrolase [Gordonia sp. HY285]|uniref:Alpha/beta fold hydrolase n=1 Tax=Gordonia liuliyuniae TaxID=2911517 RepID=A0ABS9IV11_9ACTN|nr:alpha/beta fold hydrolase [Gordonia liuliyuniae]MCF8589409.1 alpha/beta fold hydrolase [Gordonia liuliyuniae]MCF8611373.1 alpha/beta fold hydrolase [Gordonia liuliyuniae]
MDTFTRNGLTFDVTDSGPADGEPVILLHGFPQTASSWSQVSELLTAQGFRTIAPTQRGYSPGARPRGRWHYRTSELTADIVALIEQTGRGPVHVVGHDWGALVAWSLAMNRPDLVRSLTSVSVPHPGAFLRSMTRSRQALMSWYMYFFQVPWLPELVITRIRSVLPTALRRTGMSLDEVAVVQREIIDDPKLTAGALTGGLNWYRAMLLDGPTGLTRTVSAPTTHVWSSGDSALARRGAELAHEYVTGDFRLEIIDGASHWLPDQRPADLAAIILDRIS